MGVFPRGERDERMAFLGIEGKSKIRNGGMREIRSGFSPQGGKASDQGGRMREWIWAGVGAAQEHPGDQ